MAVAETLTVAGLLVLGYGLQQALQLRAMLDHGDLKEAWDALTVLIIVFIFGYLGYLAYLITGGQVVDTELLTALVFFFGAVFVAMVGYYNRQAFTTP